MKHDKYLRDIPPGGFRHYGRPRDIDLRLLADYEVIFTGKMTVTAKGEKEVRQEIKDMVENYKNALNSLTISNIKITLKKKL